MRSSKSNPENYKRNKNDQSSFKICKIGLSLKLINRFTINRERRKITWSSRLALIKLFLKELDVNILGLKDTWISVIPTQFCHCIAKAVIDNTQMNQRGNAPRKPYKDRCGGKFGSWLEFCPISVPDKGS